MKKRTVILMLLIFWIGFVSFLALRSPYVGDIIESTSGGQPPFLKKGVAFAGNYLTREYRIGDYLVNFEVPNGTEVEINHIDNREEVVWSLSFSNHKLAYRGVLQLWKIDEVKAFLDQSHSLSPFDFLSYQIKEIHQKQYDGYLTEWTREHDKQIRSGKEYWLIKGPSNDVVRITFIVDAANFSGDFDSIIRQIVDSLEIIHSGYSG